MHTRNIAKSLYFPLRAGLFIFSMVAGAVAGESHSFQPMSGACFLHDSGLEFVPSRLLGAEDVAASVDRNDPVSWTCSDPATDCARHAERFEQYRIAVDQWHHVAPWIQSLRSLPRNLFSSWVPQALGRWNSLASSIGREITRHIRVDGPTDLDCPWDRMGASHANDAPSKANIFVFTLGTAEATVVETTQRKDLREVAGEPMGPWLEKTAFARDYCVFAPYPLSGSSHAPSELLGSSESDIDHQSNQTLATEDLIRLQQHAAAMMHRTASRSLAKKMAWLGNALLRWSEDLESSVRVAEASDGSWLEEVK
jgi:hypothetical protein